MKISEIAAAVQGEILCCANRSDEEIDTAFASDMMSDVLAYVSDSGVLITGLVNPQVVRTAIMMDISCIIFVRGKCPDEAMTELARANGIVFISTEMKMFETAGRLYAAGLRP